MPILVLYLVALIEWFSTLAVEIIAIRLATPIVWSSIILTSVFLGVILLALSAGYYVGGIVASKFEPRKLIFILGWYLIFAGLYYLFISFSGEKWLLEEVLRESRDYILTLFVVAVTLFFIPVFVASQTMPILAELINETSKWKAAGKVLFASTIGSFLWSVLTSIVFFQSFGVQQTGIYVACSLMVAAAILWSRQFRIWALVSLLLGAGSWYVANNFQTIIDKNITFKFDSAYQEILVRKYPYWDRMINLFMTNGAFSSGIDPETKKSPFEYITKTVELTNEIKPKKILVIGTAWFTYPYEVSQLPFVEQIDAVDIDPRVKDIAEEHFLNDTLNEKVTFYPQSARFFINQAIAEWKKYDLVFVDAYNWKSLPDELTTQEFFQWLRKLSTNNQFVFNFILDRNLESDLAESLLVTANSVFPSLYYTYATPESSNIANVLVTTNRVFPTYASYQPHHPQTTKLYTDDRRSTELDTIALYWQ